jgi:uncharacterized protein YkwD
MLASLDIVSRLCAIGMMAMLPGCASDKNETPLFYVSMASATARLDQATAAAMISDYRRNKGLGPLQVDATLQSFAEEEARAMAAADKPASADALKARLAAKGIAAPAANLSAGYHTLAEAFSGWRDSPVHDRTMLIAGATRLGIATAYAPNSKYKVYWALIVAGN